jgi:transposase
VAEWIAGGGCTLVEKPRYSPDSWPIELAFAQIRVDLRRVAAGTRDGLEAAIATAVAQLSAPDARAGFQHCGYRFPPNLDQWFCT